MAYMNQERKAKIVAAAKPVLKKYGMKATFRCDRHKITCTLKSGAIDFIPELIDDRGNEYWVEPSARRAAYHFEINTFWFKSRYKDSIAKDFIGEMVSALEGANWYDRSDIITDYFDTAYYYSLNVGSWDTPYILTA